MNFLSEFYSRHKSFIKGKLVRILVVTALGIFAVLGLVFQSKITKIFGFRTPVATKANQQVDIPTIIDGELVLPKVSGKIGENNLGGGVGKARLAVLSANLLAVFDPQTQKLQNIRIIGEVSNTGTKIVSKISPVVRFYDAGGTVISQKVAEQSGGYEFFDLLPGGTNYYDILVAPPESSDRLEVMINPSEATSSAKFELLKISDRKFDTKVAVEQPVASDGTASGSADASGSGQTTVKKEPLQKVEYYSVSGSVINPFSDLITDISVYCWVKDSSGKVFSFAKQDFKNDLVSPGGKVDFRLTLVPFKDKETMASYELVAWGTRYVLGGVN